VICMKKVLKITIIFITIFMILCQCVPVKAYVDIEPYNPRESGDVGNGIVFANKVKRVLGIIRNIGIAVSVISLSIIGLREMLGSVEEKSRIKDSIPGYLLGLFLVVCMTVLPSILYNAFAQ